MPAVPRRPLGIAVIGYGLMGRVHAYAYRAIPIYYAGQPCPLRLVAVCDVDEARAREGVDQAGFALATTSLREAVERDDVDVVDVCTPNRYHAEAVEAALRAGKHVYCEKPLAYDLAEARRLAALAREAGVKHQVTAEYRFLPAMLRARALVAEGFLGRPFHVRGVYLHSGYVDPDRPLEWRLRREIIGGGVVVDLGPHLLDLMRHLAGEVEAVCADLETFTRTRPLPERPEVRAPVEVEDAAVCLLRFRSGALGTAELTRVATGAEDELRLELHGDRGALAFNLMDPNWLWAYDRTAPPERRGFTRLPTVQYYPPPAAVPSPKFTLGWIRSHVHAQFSFLQAIVEDRPAAPSFDDAVRVHELVDAIYRSAAARRWVTVDA
ncbi:MAG: Gfo/Idh/MocA family oxidoreductase [Armatimonadota bacterium]|nr:Gfo/Idh/MocA family oxidoreductase [Armatimonadota bacterium]